jgi:predicted secreted protein
MADGYIGYGTRLEYQDGSNWTLVGKVSDINGPSMSRDTVDITHQQSSGGYKQFLAGLADGGEVTFTINLDPTDSTHNQTAGLLSLFSETTARNWRIITPVGTGTAGQYHAYTFSALVTGFEMKFPVEDKISADVTLKVAGAVTQGTVTVS